jgi:hypothetical protein
MVASCSSGSSNSTTGDDVDGGGGSGSSGGGSGSGVGPGGSGSGSGAVGGSGSGGGTAGSGSSSGSASGTSSGGGSGDDGGFTGKDGGSGSTRDGGGATGDDGGSSGTVTACTKANATCVSNNNACNVGNTYDLYDNQWNCGGNPCGAESAYGCLNADGTVDFVVDSNQPTGNTAVLTYPAMQMNFQNGTKLSNLKSVTSTFTVVPPTAPKNDWEVAYDLWFNPNNANEFMVWVYNNGQTPGGNQVGTNVVLGGRTYNIWWSSNGGTDGTVYFVLATNITSGTIDLLQLFQYASQHGWLPANSTVDQFDMGVEVCSTNGKNAEWTFTHYSMNVTM